jgi:glutamate-1-semialdehyde aminotransferase
LIDSIDDETACVILEPFVFEEPKNNFLHELRQICNEKSIVLIFDEMWTGFRIAAGGAQQYFDVDADLVCFSKAVANGMPLSILTGKKEIMKLLEKDVFFYTTFGGEALSLAAAKATINEIISKKVPDELARKGRKLKDGLNEIITQLNINYVKCSGYDCRTIVTFDSAYGDPLLMKSFVQQEMIKNGILWSGFHNICYTHTDVDIYYTLETYEKILTQLKEVVESKNIRGKILGEPVEPVFRKTTNFNMKPKPKITKVYNDLE